MKLLDAVDANTTGASFEIVGNNARGSTQSFRSVFVYADSWGGGTVTIQVSPDNGSNWFTARLDDSTQASFTASDMKNALIRGTLIRAILTGATSPSNVTVIVL